MDVWQQPYDFTSEIVRVLCAVLAVVAILHRSSATMVLAMLMRNLIRAGKLPYIWDSEIWAFSTDAAVVLACCRKGFRTEDGDKAIQAAAPIVRTLLGMFYFAAGFWKINSSFLDSRVSCGSIFTASLLTQLWPASWGEIPTPVARMVVQLGPYLTIVGECGAGLLALLPNRQSNLLGLVLMILLHVGISFTAFPNGIANFSYCAATRYFFFLPASCATVLCEALAVPSSLAGFAGRSIAVALLSAAWYCGQAAGPQHMGAVFFSALSIMCLFALPKELAQQAAHTDSKQALASVASLGVSGWTWVLVVSVPVFLTQVLGLQDLGAPASPFSSIRVHGGSNHLLLPTGLLQAWSAAASIEETPFAGGIVRVEYTDSNWLNSLYPADHSEALRLEIRDVLHRGGHIARQFNPTPRRVLGEEIRAFMPHWVPEEGKPFMPYTVPAMEFRRMLSEVALAGENCTIAYTRLNDTLGDERWRAFAAGQEVKVAIVNGKVDTCFLSGAQSCPKDELAMQPDIGFWPSMSTAFFPHPILPDAYETGELPCMD